MPHGTRSAGPRLSPTAPRPHRAASHSPEPQLATFQARFAATPKLARNAHAFAVEAHAVRQHHRRHRQRHHLIRDANVPGFLDTPARYGPTALPADGFDESPESRRLKQELEAAAVAADAKGDALVAWLARAQPGSVQDAAGTAWPRLLVVEGGSGGGGAIGASRPRFSVCAPSLVGRRRGDVVQKKTMKKQRKTKDAGLLGVNRAKGNKTKRAREMKGKKEKNVTLCEKNGMKTGENMQKADEGEKQSEQSSREAKPAPSSLEGRVTSPDANEADDGTASRTAQASIVLDSRRHPLITTPEAPETTEAMFARLAQEGEVAGSAGKAIMRTRGVRMQASSQSPSRSSPTKALRACA